MTNPTNPLQEVKARFVEQGLPFPVIPAVFEAEFQRIAPWTYGTRSTPPASLYDIYTFVEEAQASPVDDYLLIGHDGHGTNSYAMHYYMVYGPLALFVQIGWGGVYMDKEQSIKRMNQFCSELESLLQLVDRAQNKGQPVSQPDSRIILMFSEFYGPRWRLPKDDAWREEGNAFQEAKDFLASNYT